MTEHNPAFRTDQIRKGVEINENEGPVLGFEMKHEELETFWSKTAAPSDFHSSIKRLLSDALSSWTASLVTPNSKTPMFLVT